MCLYVYPLAVAKKWHSKYVRTVTYSTIEDLVFSVQSVQYKTRSGDYFLQELLILISAAVNYLCHGTCFITTLSKCIILTKTRVTDNKNTALKYKNIYQITAQLRTSMEIVG